MIFKLEDTAKAEKIFENWQESLIWSCLQKVMGAIYVDDLQSPKSAMAVLGDFCFVDGEPDDELVMFRPESYEKRFLIMVPGSEAWEKVIETQYGDRAVKVTRYAIKKEPGIFDAEKLAGMVDALPEGYQVKMIDKELYEWCKNYEWSRDFVSQYENYPLFEQMGLGVMVLKDGIPVSGASSYSSYKGGIEVEIVTDEPCRRRGLARVCGAKLILECMKRGWYASWDARTRWSADLAEQLGYHYDHEYTAYDIEAL